MGPTSKREQGRSLQTLTTILVLALLAAVLLAGTALAAAKPGKPTAKAPKGTISTTKPTFKWSKAARATEYEVRVYKGTKLLLKKTRIARRSWKCSKALPRGVSLTWKVRGKNAAGNGAWSDPAAGGYKCYRNVVVNHGDAALPLTITTVAVKIDALSPSGGLPSGGYPVRVDGIGFGKQQGLGSVTVGGSQMTPIAWSDTAITFTVPNMGTASGPWDVKVTTDEGAKSTVKSFTFHP